MVREVGHIFVSGLERDGKDEEKKQHESHHAGVVDRRVVDGACFASLWQRNDRSGVVDLKRVHYQYFDSTGVMWRVLKS